MTNDSAYVDSRGWIGSLLEGRLTRTALAEAIAREEEIVVYQLGGDRRKSFSADFLGLTRVLLRCLQLGLGFRLGEVRRPGSFLIDRGWDDYFEPLFQEVRAPLLDRINVHQFPFARKLPFVRRLAGIWLRSTSHPRARHFMFDDLRRLEFAGALDLEGSQHYMLARRALVSLLWTYNRGTSEEVADFLGRLSLPGEYVALVIRRGDKFLEHPYVDLVRYVRSLEACGLTNGPLFVATDDVRVVAELRQMLPGREIVSAARESDVGYRHEDFKRLPASRRRAQTIALFGQLDALRCASAVLASKTINVAFVASAMRGGRDMIWVD